MARGKKHRFKSEKKSHLRLPRMPPTPPKQEQQDSMQLRQLSSEKKPLWRRFAVLIWTFVVFVFGYIGFEAVFPRVIIDASQATTKGFLSTHFTLENQAMYPIEVSQLTLYIVDLAWPQPRNSTIQNVGILCPNVEIKVRGRESGAVQIDKVFSLTDTNNPPTQIKEGSKIIVQATYRLPFGRFSRTDSALFWCARDSSGNQMWVKKPLGKYADYKFDYPLIIYTPKIEGD